MRRSITWALAALCCFFAPAIPAQDAAATPAVAAAPEAAQAVEGGMTAEQFESSLKYQTGTVALPGGMATINLPPSFRFLNKADSKRVLTMAWGNPEESASDVLGMLIPTATSPVEKEGWGIVITYDEDGYVSDKDAAEMNYDKMLKEMQSAIAASNKEREAAGYETMTLVGWAEPPSYDAATHKMYWAKDLVFGDAQEHTLNYAIRILGRRGVLQLNAVSSIEQLPQIRNETKNVLAAVDFNEGHRYADFLPGKDKVAEYGLAGLLVGAGAVAAKTGLFKGLWVMILALKKVIIVAVIALIAGFKKLFGMKAKDA